MSKEPGPTWADACAFVAFADVFVLIALAEGLQYALWTTLLAPLPIALVVHDYVAMRQGTNQHSRK
ncbi:hypothetical protein L1785_21635 [Antribacter sp. KLBMP9083]|uniref:Uncharacterized protein n=1 Tax=Antribacter soli TaxID=2910976 RepID=A0AA41QIW9_9MICO|nr:hypothetical protein [Antribacter soli]MCF4123575.1 hypothetical protein [Antribacter soli]